MGRSWPRCRRGQGRTRARRAGTSPGPLDPDDPHGAQAANLRGMQKIHGHMQERRYEQSHFVANTALLFVFRRSTHGKRRKARGRRRTLSLTSRAPVGLPAAAPAAYKAVAKVLFESAVYAARTRGMRPRRTRALP